MTHCGPVFDLSVLRDFLKYWKRTWNWRYGSCYTFNSGATDNGKKLPVLTSTKPGPKYGKKNLNKRSIILLVIVLTKTLSTFIIISSVECFPEVKICTGYLFLLHL